MGIQKLRPELCGLQRTLIKGAEGDELQQAARTVQDSGLHLQLDWIVGIIAVLFGVCITLIGLFLKYILSNIKDDMMRLEKSSEELFGCKNEMNERITRIEDKHFELSRQHDKNHG
jgi:hypothetical protein